VLQFTIAFTWCRHLLALPWLDLVKPFFLLRPYSSEVLWACLSVCLFVRLPVCEHISELHVISTNLLCMLPTAVARNTPLAALRYVLHYIWFCGRQHDVTFAHNGQMHATRIGHIHCYSPGTAPRPTSASTNASLQSANDRNWTITTRLGYCSISVIIRRVGSDRSRLSVEVSSVKLNASISTPTEKKRKKNQAK